MGLLTSGHNTFEVPSEFTRGPQDSEESIRSALWLIDHISDHLGIGDLGDTEVLDIGCGVKFTQALVGRSLPVKQYVGVDLYREMIEFLQQNVRDARFEYFHIDAHNALYNPQGEPLSADTRLPLGERRFDLICLLSVFTHLAPRDYRIMLELLRPHVKPEGKLFFSLFIDELTEGGHGLMDTLYARSLDATDPVNGKAATRRANHEAESVEPFKDLDPTRPLHFAVYSEEYARELIAGTGWEVLSLSPPEEYIQHHFVCVPC